MKFLSFPSIEQFHNIIRAIEAYPHIAPGTVTYRGKVNGLLRPEKQQDSQQHIPHLQLKKFAAIVVPKLNFLVNDDDMKVALKFRLCDAIKEVY